MSAQVFTGLIAIVTGSFLHISTTIVFESSSDHKFNGKKMSIAVLAAVIAISMEWFF
jgi:zinc and cadmium transporter